MRVHVVSPDALTADDVAIWRAHQRADESLESPFFTPEYVGIAASIRPSTEVAVIESPGQPAAFLPFDRGRDGIARPVGLRAADFSGAIAPPGYVWSPRDALRAGRLNGWDFAHTATTSAALQPYFRAFVESPFIDVSGGLRQFEVSRRQNGSDVVRGTLQKRRKAEREAGEVRAELQTRDSAVLDQLVTWKSAQRARTGTTDVLQRPWFLAMLRRIIETDTPEFAGMLSALYVGDRLAAVHCGMRSQTAWHYWFAAYNPDLERYSPGLVLLLAMVEAAPALGIRTLTLGHGQEPYKQRFATGVTQLASGSVDRRLLRRGANTLWYSLRRLSHRSPALASVAAAVKRAGYARARYD